MAKGEQELSAGTMPAPGGRPSLAAQIFPGKGEMAQLIRAIDWGQTSLGPVESWPQSLRTAVSICLGSRHPIVLWWGPERWMFYNDGYRPMLGESKHPQFLGAPGQECWAEIWDIIGPMMDQVIETGEATWSEDLLLADVPLRLPGGDATSRSRTARSATRPGGRAASSTPAPRARRASWASGA